MNTPTVVASVLLATSAAAAITFVGRPADESLPDPELASARTEVASLREQVARLEARLNEVAAAPVTESARPARVEVPTVSNEQVAVAVEAYLRERMSAGAVPASIDGVPLSLDEVFAGLAGTNFWENGELWRKAHDDGRMDEVIEKFEADAEAFPNDVNKQMALASAYMAYLQMDPSKWQLSMKADQAFDRVLDIDERHWEARFTKAVSYTFWPDFLGKKKDALSQFQTLVDQQEAVPAEDHHAQTYLYLGNLLEGEDGAKARAMWERGLARHPNNEELRQRLGQ